MSVKVRDVKHDGTWWVVVHKGGKRFKRKVGPDLEAAEAVAAQVRREEAGAGAAGFASFAELYYEADWRRLAATTRRDRRLHIKRLAGYFGELPLAQFTRARLRTWWDEEIEKRELAPKTGKNHLDTLSAIFAHAVELELVEASPVEAFRRGLRRLLRTKRGRAQQHPSDRIQPLEEFAEISALVRGAREVGGDEELAVLVLLDAGLRVGEAGGLRWADVWWGRSSADPTRHLWIRASRPRGGPLEPTKSGRPRRVALSRRLRAALLERYVARGQPERGSPVADRTPGAGERRPRLAAAELVLPHFDPSNFRKRFARICRKAELGARRPKDLRDTFASQLLTAGVPLGYISAQLGHGSVDVTARHYARWCGNAEDRFCRPIVLEEGEVPADLLDRLTRAKRARPPAAPTRPQRPQRAAGEPRRSPEPPQT